ncbi:putative tetratricopeptide-like helical domain-containing protein [Rosa chinensis]|uniref:Putative tetratricopeptide-like helical domain-containing protein n=1 Tax=Rosa chinensis TaxID=74649 RepID=A0A2P6S9I4_ROSCH|nr:putative tetratricopeptide-like helical domain-containing protein [Rosa chinensis]
MYFKCGDEGDAHKVFDKMFVRNLYSWNNMLSGNAKMRNLKEARSLFEKMPERDVGSWNTMVIGYAQTGECDEALRFYRESRRSSVTGVLTGCVKMREWELITLLGRLWFGHINRGSIPETLGDLGCGFRMLFFVIR